MKQRFSIYSRPVAGKKLYYLKDKETGKRTSLKTTSKTEAERLLNAHREASQQPSINLQLARAYLTAGDPAFVKRIWQDVLDSIVPDKTGATHARWLTAAKDKAFDLIRN